MKLERYKKLIIGLMLTLIVLPICSNIVNADINESYYSEIKSTALVSSSMLSSILSSDILIDPLAKLIYSVGNFMEYIVGGVVLAATGDNIFPWADAIVFNAIPMLDVNFISPYEGSIIANLRGVLQGIYSSLFGLAELFFGIAVLLMGIKLAVSAIAAEKAKYKDALVKWAIGLVLLFGMQFFISFVFHLNEQLVEVASKISSDNLQNSEFVEQFDAATNSISDRTLVENLFEAMTTKSWTWYIAATGGVDMLISSIQDIVAWIGGDETSWECVEYITTALEEYDNGNSTKVNVIAYLLKDADYREATGMSSGLVNARGSVWDWSFTSANFPVMQKLVQSTKRVIDRDLSNDGINVGLGMAFNEGLEQEYREAAEAYEEDPTSEDKKNDMIIARAEYNAKMMIEGDIGSDRKSIITGLASYFKTTAWTYEEGDWKPTKVVLENAILYAILVVQSVILLIAYVKRLFYVIILALMAPIVVVYDFVKKLI